MLQTGSRPRHPLHAALAHIDRYPIHRYMLAGNESAQRSAVTDPDPAHRVGVRGRRRAQAEVARDPGYLAVGMLLGPHALALALDNETTQLLADFGVVFLVFTLGLEFSLPRLVAMRWEVLGVGGAQVLITTGIVAAGAVLFFGVVPAVAVVIGGAVAMSSTAIIIAQLTEQSENNRTHGRLAVAICLFQDLSFPLFLALVSVLGGGGQPADARHIGGAIGIAVLALLLVLAAGRWLLRPLFLMHRLGAFRGTVFAGGAARGAGLGLGHARGGPVARARRLSGRHDAGGDRVPSSDRGDDPLLPRSIARPVLHHRRHAARCRACCCGICRW